MRPHSSVLIVEDEAISALFLKRALAVDYRIIGTARSGEEAIELADREKPDIIIMDVHLDGEMDGVEAARRIRLHMHPQVVFCSAYQRSEIGDPVGQGLGEALISKPISSGALLALLGSLAAGEQ